MNVISKVSSGIKSMVSIEKSMSQVQASWRFLNNDIVDIKIENEPVVEKGVEEINARCNKYCLVAHDWSEIDYKNHNEKEELLEKREIKKIIGYELQSSLAIDDERGKSISPLAQNLKSSKKVYSTYTDEIDYTKTHLEELAERIKWIKTLNIDKKIVNMIDREGDSVGFLRDIKDELFLIRVRNQPTIHWIEKDLKINGKALSNQLEHKLIKKIKYKNQTMTLHGCEVDIEVKRQQSIDRKIDGERVQKRIDGEPVKARFISVKLVDKNNKEISRWLLLSNVEEDVSLDTLVTWYYYRWNIESYFKLLKSSGHQLESWQQKTPKAIFRRLIIVSYACVLVWQLANAKDKKAEELRNLLVRLSGRQMSYGTDFTYPALFAGLWTFLSMMKLMEIYDFKDLLDMKSYISDFFQGAF